MTSQIDTIQKFLDLVSTSTLGAVIRELESTQVLLGYNALTERLSDVKRDYNLMRDFSLRGGTDNQRDAFYATLKRRLYGILADLRMIKLVKLNPTLTSAKNASLGTDNPILIIRQLLEELEADIAMAAINPDAKTSTRDAMQRLHIFRQKYFNSLLTLSQISEAEQRELTELILSPTISQIDRQLVISALMIATQVQYDNNKFLALLRAYTASTDELLSAQLLVALMLSVHDDSVAIYTDTDNEMLEIFSTPEMKRQLVELQMQMDLANRVDELGRKVQEDIMPDLVKHSEEAMRDDSDMFSGSEIDEIIDPSASESSIEKLEQRVNEMENLKQQGVDIYYQGFSQMKRYSFFYTLVNWFYPFTPDHPQLSHIDDQLLHSKMFEAMAKTNALCDSDIYSIMLGMQSVWRMFPEKMKELIGSKDFVLPDMDYETSPAFYRRMFLQNLLRFYRLYPQKNDFPSPFERQGEEQEPGLDRWFFLANRVFADSGLFVDEMVELTRYFFKRQQYGYCNHLLNLLDFHELTREQETLLDIIEAIIAFREQNHVACSDILAGVLEEMPDNRLAMEYFVEASIKLKEYSAAVEYAQQLSMLFPENIKHQLNYITILLATGAKNEASEQLFRLYFDHPDDADVVSEVAMLYLRTKRAEQALDLLTKNPMHDVQLRIICLLALHRTAEAIAAMKEYLLSLAKTVSDFDEQLVLNDFYPHLDLLTPYGLTLTDVEILVDNAESSVI